MVEGSTVNGKLPSGVDKHNSESTTWHAYWGYTGRQKRQLCHLFQWLVFSCWIYFLWRDLCYTYLVHIL